MEAFSSSSPFFLIRNDKHLDAMDGQQSPTLPPAPPPSSSATGNSQAAPPAKKKRNHHGNPNPDAEVIALSPKTLMATNRFICEVCKKGFQREQNLQLHRRGHNLPWKLKQRSGKEARRRVYLCPEPGCVHHDPSRALGDLTGVKKHFSRKHGEKKWKCEKCAKRYAVKSDCKAHFKTCGTREYQCDCGTLFSRRDSFITHRAFCDVLTQENSRLPSELGTFTSHFYRNNSDSNNNNNISQGISQFNSSHASHDLLRHSVSGPNIALATQYDHLIAPPTPPFSFHLPPGPFFLADDAVQSKLSLHSPIQFPISSNPYNPNFFSNTTLPLMMHDQFDETTLMNNHIQSLFGNSAENDNGALPQLSATAMLQRAVQIGSSSSLGDRILSNQVENDEKHIMDIMNSFANGNSGVFGVPEEEEGEEIKCQKNGLTRDFLGVGSMLRSMGRGMALDPRDPNDSETSNKSFHGRDFVQ